MALIAARGVKGEIPRPSSCRSWLFVCTFLSSTGFGSQLVSIWLIISPLTHGNPNHQQHQHYFHPGQPSSLLRLSKYEVNRDGIWFICSIAHDWNWKMKKMIWNIWCSWHLPPPPLPQSQYWSEIKVRDGTSVWSLGKYFYVWNIFVWTAVKSHCLFLYLGDCEGGSQVLYFRNGHNSFNGRERGGNQIRCKRTKTCAQNVAV